MATDPRYLKALGYSATGYGDKDAQPFEGRVLKEMDPDVANDYIGRATAQRERQVRIQAKWDAATEALLDQIIALSKPGQQMNDGTGAAVAGYGQCLASMMVAVAEQRRGR